MTFRLTQEDYLRLLNGNKPLGIKKSNEKKIVSHHLPKHQEVRKNKYGNKKCIFNNIKFDSKLEMERYIALSMMLKLKEISGLELQKVFTLDVGGVKVCEYRADFTYYDKNGIYHVEDAKGVKTKEYIIKKKLMLAVYGIEIEEIVRPPSLDLHINTEKTNT